MDRRQNPPHPQPSAPWPYTYPRPHGAQWQPPADHSQQFPTPSHSSQHLLYSPQNMQWDHQQQLFWQHHQQQQLLQLQQQREQEWAQRFSQQLHQRQQELLHPQLQPQQQNSLQHGVPPLSVPHSSLPPKHHHHQVMPTVPPHAWIGHSAVNSQPPVDWSYNPHESQPPVDWSYNPHEGSSQQINANAAFPLSEGSGGYRGSTAAHSSSSLSSSSPAFIPMHGRNIQVAQDDGTSAGQHSENTRPNVSPIIGSSSETGAQEAENKPDGPNVTIGDLSQKWQEQRRPPPGFTPLNIQIHRPIQQVTEVADSIPTISSKMVAQKMPIPSANPLSEPENKHEKEETTPEVKPEKEKKDKKPEIEEETKGTKPEVEPEKEKKSDQNDGGNMADRGGAFNSGKVPNVPTEKEPSSPTSTRQQISRSEQKEDDPKSPRKMAPIHPGERVSGPNILPLPSSDVLPKDKENLDVHKNSEKIDASIEEVENPGPVEAHKEPSKTDESPRGNQSVIGKNEADTGGYVGLHGGVQLHHSPKGILNPQSTSPNESSDSKFEGSPSATAQSTKTPEDKSQIITASRISKMVLGDQARDKKPVPTLPSAFPSENMKTSAKPNVGMTSRKRRQQKKLEREKALENERAKAEMDKEDNESQKIDEAMRGGKDSLDTLLATTSLGELGSPHEDLRKHLHTMFDKQMEDIGKEKIKQSIELGEYISKQMWEKNLTDNESMQISASQIQPIDHKGFGKASDLKDTHTGKSSTASGSSSSKLSSSSGTTAHKLQKKTPIDHRKEEIQEIFDLLNEDRISEISTLLEMNKKLKSKGVEYLLFTIELLHDKLYTYWSLNYELHGATKHEEIGFALVKMAFYLHQDLGNKIVDAKIYEDIVRPLKQAVIMLGKIWMNPDTKGEIISKRYKKENYRFTNWMLCFDELINELDILYEKIKIFDKKKKIDEEGSRQYFHEEINMNKSLNGLLRKALGMVMIGFYEENLEMKKMDVFLGINKLDLWLPGYKDNVERARKIMWNYFKIERDMLEKEIETNFGKYFEIVFHKELPKEGDYMGKITKFSDKKSKPAVNEIYRFIKSEKAKETPKDVVDSLLALKEHIVCVHFMIKMFINMGSKEVKSKLNEEERNAFWTIVDKEKLIPSEEKSKAGYEIIRGGNFGFKMDIVQRGLESVNKLKVAYEFAKKRIEAKEDWDACKPHDGYEDYSAEREDSEKEEIKQVIEFEEHYKREMREKNLTDNEAMKISSSQIYPIDPKGLGKASDLKDPHTAGKSSTASGSSSSKLSSSSGTTAHKQQNMTPIERCKEIQEIFSLIDEDKISEIFTLLEMNKKLKSKGVEYLLFTIELLHDKLYTYWSLNYEVHGGMKHEDIASALVKMGSYRHKDLRQKDFYEAIVRPLKQAVIMLVKIWMNPDTKGEITSKLYMNKNYRFTNWMLCFDKLIKVLNRMYENIKIFHKKNMINEPFEESRAYFEAEIKMDKTLNRILRKALGVVIIGFYEENVEMKKFDVFVGINNLMVWLPGYKDKVARTRKILWNYFKIERDILEKEIETNFGKYYEIIFHKKLEEGNYVDINTKFSDKHSNEAVYEIDRFIKSEKAKETPKDVIESLLALKEHILCVHFMIKMHLNMGKEEVKSKMNEEERNAFWTIVDKKILNPSAEKFNKGYAIISGGDFGFNLVKVQQGSESVNKLKVAYEFVKKATAAKGDWEECKPHDGYEDFSAEREDSEKEDIKPDNTEVLEELRKHAEGATEKFMKLKAKADVDLDHSEDSEDE